METISVIVGTFVVVLFMYLGCRECYRDYNRHRAITKALRAPPPPRTLPVNHITDPRMQ